MIRSPPTSTLFPYTTLFRSNIRPNLKLVPSLAFGEFGKGDSSLSRRKLSFPSQVTDLTLFNPFYPHPRSFQQSQHSASFHQKSPAIPPIPLNSTYTVPRNLTLSGSLFPRIPRIPWLLRSWAVGLSFPSQIPAFTIFTPKKISRSIKIKNQNSEIPRSLHFLRKYLISSFFFADTSSALRFQCKSDIQKEAGFQTTFCSLHSALCIHQTRIVPRFFALY